MGPKAALAILSAATPESLAMAIVTVGAVVITQYSGQTAADAFRHRLKALGITSYLHYPIPGYPNDIARIVSDEGYGRNEYIETTRPLVVVTAQHKHKCRPKWKML